jgi:hypothetical protein
LAEYRAHHNLTLSSAGAFNIYVYRPASASRAETGEVAIRLFATAAIR